jgi:SAM-dependent methyltransferase
VEAGVILDIGCGGGLFPGMLRERGYRAVGLDVSARAAALAWKRHGVPAVAGELSRSPIAPDTCAAVTMFHVLEHLDHPECCLGEAHRLLRPGGRLIVQVPNAASWQFAFLGAAWNGVDTPRHIHLFRDSDLEKLLVKCGFVPLRKKYFSWRDNPAGLATSLAPSLDPMARRVRGGVEAAGARLAKDMLYFALVMASVPFAAAEAMVQAGSTIMIEAQKAA